MLETNISNRLLIFAVTLILTLIDQYEDIDVVTHVKRRKLEGRIYGKRRRIRWIAVTLNAKLLTGITTWTRSSLYTCYITWKKKIEKIKARCGLWYHWRILIIKTYNKNTKLMSMEMDFFRRSARCSRLEKNINNLIGENWILKTLF